jgi:hypothetical protein
MYYAKLLEQIQNGKGYWSSQKIGVFDKANNNKVGEYLRNYPNFGETTFAPFEHDEQWYALYSRSYVALSVMKISEYGCEHLGGEDEKDPVGFCPVDIYIPRYQWWRTEGETDPEQLKKYPEQNRSWISKDSYQKQYDDASRHSCFDDTPEVDNQNQNNEGRFMGLEEDHKIFYENFAFIGGMRWGDDSSIKIEIRDISQAYKGIISIIDKWGYYEIPHNLKLKESIRLTAFDQYSKEEESSINITMAIQKTLRLHPIKKQVFDFDDSEDVKKLFKDVK